MPLLLALSTVYYLCLLDTFRHVLIQQFHVPPTQAHNTGYGVDTQFFQPQQQVTASNLIVSAGTANRDYRTLVEATRSLDVQVKIAADSAWFPASIDIAQDDLPSHVEAKSAGDYLGLRDLYARAAFVVVPLQGVKHACG